MLGQALVVDTLTVSGNGDVNGLLLVEPSGVVGGP